MLTGNRRVNLQADLANTANLTRFIIPHFAMATVARSDAGYLQPESFA